MAGESYVYQCNRCPLILELGGLTAWGDDGSVHLQQIQVACASCGTMHRLTEEFGTCSVSALPGPVRGMRPVILRDVCGENVETREWAAEPDWLSVGQHPGGIAAVSQLSCNFCGQAGRMVWLAKFFYPGGYKAGARRLEECPVCGHPMDFVAVTDSI